MLSWFSPSLALGWLALSLKGELASILGKDSPTPRQRCGLHLGIIPELTLWLGTQVSGP